MRTREVTVPWNEMQEGDKFLRFEQRDPSDKVIVQREAPDLPRAKGTMGYATIERDGVTIGDVLLVRTYGEGSDHPHAWVAPFQTGSWHTVNDGHIVEFQPMDLVPVIDCRTMMEAIIKGSGQTKKGLEFVGTDVRGIYNAVANLLYPSE